ncbi:lysophospholipid acyltransferase family protein [Rapidithrix thailandica]|uniref:Lysophospholipid acyltransferase family protein n=1 Tax=Rapidithrix thailandica TaxID=413964 RepID=A0AAW9SHF9_9BACT
MPKKNFFNLLYALWYLLWFWVIFILIYPLFLLTIFVKKWRPYSYKVNNIWAYTVYFLVGLPVKVQYRFPFDKKGNYVFCPNHNSYLDIPILGYAMRQFGVYVGKSQLSKVPLFGYMFKKLYISVDRNSLRDRYQSFELAKNEIDQGNSLIIFPEGGTNQNPPVPKRFKDGAFRIAIEKQVPIVPVTIPQHWLVMHDISPYLHWSKIEVIFHEPIATTGMTIDQADDLKEQVYSVIYNEMKSRFPKYFEKETVNK